MPKPVNVSWEQVSGDLQFARVDGFEFAVERYSNRKLFRRRRPPYGYRITATFLDHNAYVLTPEIFEGMSDEQVRGHLANAISRQLEEYTDYFSSK